jgi:ribonucleotide reductase alpha subunit
MDTENMRVTKRNGELEEIAFDKILNRIKKLGKEASLHINYQHLVMKVIDQLYDTISTTKIDELTAEQCASMSTLHPDYGVLAGRIVVSNHHKNTDSSFTDIVNSLYNYFDKQEVHRPLVSEKLWQFVNKYSSEIEAMIDQNRDYLIDYFGFKTLERSYLFKKNGKILERPQHMWMRVAIGIHGMNIDLNNSNDKSLELVKETYDLMSTKYFTHATPTLFNAGTNRPQMSSCYLIGMEDDSIDGIFNTLKDCALISKYSGGIGLHIHNIRAKGSHIQGTNGTTDGIVPMLRVFNNTARYVNQSGKRNGSFAIYLEPWHADILDFLEMRKNHGDEDMKARDLFYALWVPDLFMKRVKEKNGKWSLMCPSECPGLSDAYGDQFEELYLKYEEQGKARKTIMARDLWFAILDAQMETGTPYLLYKDAVNKKSNQKNIGTIKSSNLCVAPETLVLTDKGHIEIHSLENQEVNVWNGEEWSNVTIKKTGVDQELMTITILPNNSTQTRSLRCTPYHKFYIKNGNSITEVRANELTINNKLIGYKNPTTDNLSEYVYDCGYDFAFVVKIQKCAEKDNTYCFTEPKRHMGIFNGIITGQCCEITEYSDDKETAVCNLASIALPAFVDESSKTFDFDLLHKVTKVVTNNLNKVIDINFYPTEKTYRSNKRHRPIGIGVQGLADTFIMLDMPFFSDEAKQINKQIFETIYHASLEKSNEMAIELTNIMKNSSRQDILEMITEHEYSILQRQQDCVDLLGAYSSFEGSPASQGILQFDMWNVTPSDKYNWNELKESIKKYGLRNSLLVAPMPTASTSQILGYTECFEPLTSNIYSRRTMAGEFIVVNKHLMRDLIQLGLWNEQIKNNIIANRGSVQQLTMLSQHMRDKYKIVWEIPMKNVIDMSADRGPFICQSQSLNLWMEEPVYNKLTSMHFYAWEKGLKTGIYYLRRKAKHQAQQFTIEPEAVEVETKEEICEMCSA